MSDAVRCPNCGYVYWSRWNENWSSCPKCYSNNDFYNGPGKPCLVSSEDIFRFVTNTEAIKKGYDII